MNKPNSAPKTLFGKVSNWLRQHKLDVLIVAVLLAIGGTVSAINMTGYPQRFEDEGTYVSQAWAVKENGTLAHYTYWYDHPPAGWIQIAGWFAGTNALERYGSAITAGREFMLVIHLATIVLLFALARRLRVGSIAAGLGVLIYCLSPLTVEFSRYVLLDNVALPWLLGAFVLALSPRRSFKSAILSAVCMAIAILSKETFLALLPVLLCTLWRNGDKRNRRYLLTAFGVVFVTISGAYLLYAILKNELIPGPGHVSLIGSLLWQLSGREGSGSIFDAASSTRGLIGYWLNIDFWLLAAGAVCLPIALFYKDLRPAGFGLLIGLALLLRSGYLPYPYVIVLLPFAGLAIAGALDRLVFRPLLANRAKRAIAAAKLSAIATAPPSAARMQQIRHGRTHDHIGLNRTVAALAFIALAINFAAFVAPSWQSKLSTLTNNDQDTSSRQAVNWVEQNVSRDSRLIVESALWTDLESKGFSRPNPVWLYKTETDPAVSKEIGGWQGIDYVILNGPTLGGKDFDKSFPTVNAAIEHGELVKTFGADNQKILIYRVNH